jgi:L-aminopeptidase/D-esterase-like protein
MEKEFIKINGVKIGHATNLDAATGCTVVICEQGAIAGVDVRGGSPGTRETDSLNPVNAGNSIHAVLLTGGSAFGLDAAAGVMQYLEERKIGRDVKVTHVPIVCGAVLFDLMCGGHSIRPDKKMGYDACFNATSEACAEGSVGAGTGATIGKIKGYNYAMKGGLGTSYFQTGDLIVGAIMAVNCIGDIFDTKTNRLIAGVLKPEKQTVANTEQIMIANYNDKQDFFSGNTIIGVVVTNAKLSKPEANKLASMAQNGIGRAVRPAHTTFDGDTIFAMSTGEVEANINTVGMLAAKAVENAILRGVKTAEPIHGFKAFRDIEINNI